MSPPYPRVRVAIDRGGTFTDVYATVTHNANISPDVHVLKLLSVDPRAYADAPTEGIRRVLRLAGVPDSNADSAVPTAHLEEIRMGTTVATNALLERDGCPTGLVATAGLRDVLRIGTQARPDIFDLSVAKPTPLYRAVVEADERVIVVHSDKNPGVTSMRVEKELDLEALRAQLKVLRDRGIVSLAVALMHSYAAPQHEEMVAEEARSLGFDHVSISSALTPMVKIVPRAFTAVVDAYLSPKIRDYIVSFRSRFEDDLRSVRVQFMRSDGGLCSMDDFSGYLAILSGPAGGVVGYAKTAYAFSLHKHQLGSSLSPQAVIGFDMGGTSTDVSRYAGHLEHVFETQTAGVTIQAPQLDITTVAAGGGSRLFFRSGMFVVGPSSAGSDPGPVCYRKGGFLAVTDANVLLGRVVPELFPRIFGKNADEVLSVDATRAAFMDLTASINDQIANEGVSMTPEQVALGFINVANESMGRPIRAITEARGYETRDHILACFGGAGGQHACAVARSLGIKTVYVHRYSGILSAYGIAIADSVSEAQKPLGLRYFDGIRDASTMLDELSSKAVTDLLDRGFHQDQIVVEKYLNLRYDGTDFAMMVTARDSASDVQDGVHDFASAFVDTYHREHGFTIPGRPIWIDDVRVRALGSSATAKDHLEGGYWQEDRGGDIDCTVPAIMETQCYFEETGFTSTPVTRLVDMASAQKPRVRVCVSGPAIVIDKDATIVVEPGCVAHLTTEGDVVIDINVPSVVAGDIAVTGSGLAPSATALPSVFSPVTVADIHPGSNSAASSVTPVDRVKLSVFGHRFMGIAEQMGRTLARTAISTNIKERLDFSCALFDPRGGLVANAPHVPVHLGSMQDAVRYQIRLLGESWKDGEVILCNHPRCGGTHLPDVTVITPVYHDGKPVFYVASRGHQADIGGIAPGSMPPFSRALTEEGMAVESLKVVRDGEFQEDELVDLLTRAGGRCIKDVTSDIRAQVAANKKGISLVGELIRSEGLATVHEYMAHIQNAAADAVRDLLKRVSVAQKMSPVGMLCAEDFMDDGTPVRLAITIDRDAGNAVFDFTGTGPSVANGNTNAPRSIASSAVIYALRSMVTDDIPMNQGCLDPVSIILPEDCLLNPSSLRAVCGGNVLTSQRITDVILRAFGACASSQGCMNNVTFGTATTGYYETIAGGAGAGPGWHGTSATQSHMTNTRITDAEILERRYPAILRIFAVREGSGGAGQWRGGDGVVREIEFTAPVTFSVLSERRGKYAPGGLEGGFDALCGVNTLRRAGQAETDLGGKNTVELLAGDAVRIETPGGGGYGRRNIATAVEK
jgi:5-oxoprolinase (ATP-hydrolysing)